MRLKIIKILTIIGLFFSPSIFADILMQGGYSHEFIVSSGGHYQRTIKLKNRSSSPQEVKVYLEDYRFQTGGRSMFTSPYQHKNTRSNANWIQLNTSGFIIPPHGEQKVSYTIQVPRSGVSGTYWSALIIEPVSSTSLESSLPSSQDNKVHMNIQQVSRHAVQIVTQIGETGRVNLKLQNPTMKKYGAKRLFSLDAYNHGTRWIKPNVWLDIYNQQGNYIGKFKGDGARVYPNTSTTFSVDISSLRKGKYKGLFVVDDERTDVLGTDVNIEIK